MENPTMRVERSSEHLSPDNQQGVREAFQSRVQPWMMTTFGAEISADMVERCDRFIEEALERSQPRPSSNPSKDNSI